MGMHADRNDVLSDHDAVGLGELVAAGEVTPLELLDATIARAEAVNGDINAIVSKDYDRARDRAARATTPASDRVGPFDGVPMFIKDMGVVEGLQTGFGSGSMASSAPAKADDPVVAMIRGFGMTLPGTSTTPEFGLTCSTEFPDAPPTRNPWNPDHTASGSSGGAAALVAAGVSPMAHGGDGGGSLRLPASACGLVGLKASRHRLIGLEGDDKMPVEISVAGVMSCTVRDTCTFMAEAERHHHSAKLPPLGLVDRPLDRPLRIGVLVDVPTDAVVEPQVRSAVDDTVNLLESLGHRVDATESPIGQQFEQDFILYWAFLALSLQKGGRKIIHPDFDASGLSPFVNGLSDFALRNLYRLPAAVRRLRRSTEVLTKGFGSHDLLLTPTAARRTPELGFFDINQPFDALMPKMAQWACYTPMANTSGLPAISLPLGHDHELNLPIGMQFLGRMGQERLLLELALQLEAAQPFRRLG